MKKSKNPNPEQIALAESLGIKLPPGYTYVKEHDREGSKEFVRKYKSRSAVNLLYGIR